MKNIKEAPFLQEITRLTSNMYRLGWDERNGGNVSYLVTEEELKDYIDFSVIRTLPLNFHAPELAGKIYLVTGTGVGTATVTWDDTKIALSDVSLEMLMNISGATRSGSSITFPVDADVEDRYDLQFYKVSGANFTGITWPNMNGTVVQFSFS